MPQQCLSFKGEKVNTWFSSHSQVFIHRCYRMPVWTEPVLWYTYFLCGWNLQSGGEPQTQQQGKLNYTSSKLGMEPNTVHFVFKKELFIHFTIFLPFVDAGKTNLPQFYGGGKGSSERSGDLSEVTWLLSGRAYTRRLLFWFLFFPLTSRLECSEISQIPFHPPSCLFVALGARVSQQLSI